MDPKATIFILGKTLKDSVLHMCPVDAEEDYSERLPEYLKELKAKAVQEGFDVEYQANRDGPNSYVVCSDTTEGLNAAHEFMQWEAPEFWN